MPGSSMAVSKKIKYLCTLWLYDATPRDLDLRKALRNSQEYVYKNVHSDIVYNERNRRCAWSLGWNLYTIGYYEALRNQKLGNVSSDMYSGLWWALFFASIPIGQGKRKKK